MSTLKETLQINRINTMRMRRARAAVRIAEKRARAEAAAANAGGAAADPADDCNCLACVMRRTVRVVISDRGDDDAPAAQTPTDKPATH